MKARVWGRLAPGGSAIPMRALVGTVLHASTRSPLEAQLAERMAGRQVSLHASGREALRVVLAQVAKEAKRDEVLLPGYCCYSLPAATVAAGLRVRLVDVDEKGRIDERALASQPLDRVAAIVVGNLFGLPDPIDGILEIARAAGVAVIDDAAQSLGAWDESGPVGARADFGILSFGRGKPLSAMGGGAAIWNEEMKRERARPNMDVGSRGKGAVRGLLYDVARWPLAFRALSAVPSLGIGETEYDPGFTRGEIDTGARALASELLSGLEAWNDDRRARAESLAEVISSQTEFEVLTARVRTFGIYPRIAILAPSRPARDAALEGLRSYGATSMYPAPAFEIEGLSGSLTTTEPLPGARRFCDRLVTLPAHPGMTARRIAAVIEILARTVRLND